MKPKDIIRHYVDLAASNPEGYKAVTYEEISASCGVSADKIKTAFGGEEMQFKAINHYIKGRCREFNLPLSDKEEIVMEQFVAEGEL